MKKGLWVVVLAICVGAGAAWAVDINPALVRGGNIQSQPSVYLGEGVLKKLYDNAAQPAHPEYVYDWNDGEVWFYDNDPYKTWVYMLYKFVKPTGFPESGNLRWKVWPEATGNTVYIHRWTVDRWTDVTSGTGNWIHYCNISEEWFDSEDSIWFLVEVETTTSNPGVYTDVFDIQY